MIHKQFLANPYDLVEAGFNVTKICQEEGDIVITFPQAYHSGFNLGKNINEAFNFGTKNWLPHFMQFSPCSCKLVPKFRETNLRNNLTGIYFFYLDLRNKGKLTLIEVEKMIEELRKRRILGK